MGIAPYLIHPNHLNVGWMHLEVRICEEAHYVQEHQMPAVHRPWKVVISMEKHGHQTQTRLKTLLQH